MKALILVAFATFSAQLSTPQELRVPDQEVTLQMPCRDARAVAAEARKEGLSVTFTLLVPAGTIMVISDSTSAAVILVHEGLACLLGAGDLPPPTAKPQRLTPRI